MDEVFIQIQGAQHHPWVPSISDQRGVVLEILVQDRRDGHAAKCFFRRLLKGLQYALRVIVPDKLKSAARHRAICFPMSNTGRLP